MNGGRLDRFRAFHMAVSPLTVVDCEGMWEVTHRFLSKLLLDY